MNLNEYTFNNPNYLAKNKKYNNENYPYNNQFKYKNKYSSLLNTKKTFNDNINNNLNTEYFNNFYKKILMNYLKNQRIKKIILVEEKMIFMLIQIL